MQRAWAAGEIVDGRGLPTLGLRMTERPIDRRAIEAELEAGHERCFGWALACCGWDRDEAADVLQASYLKVLDGRARFESRSRLSTFVYGVVRRTAAERRRKRARRRVLLLARTEEPDPEAQAELTRLPGEVRRLREALASLPPRQREVLHLVFYVDLSIAEAADVMGVSLGSARTHYHRGKAKLRAQLELQTARPPGGQRS